MELNISLRVSAKLWMQPDRVEELLALLARHPAIREVAFFTQWTHPPLPLQEIEKRAASLRDLIPRFRALGLRAGINHLSTIGHLDENLENSLREPWQRLTDPTGKAAGGSFCLSDERLREYVRRAYGALASAGPDFIWVDDDLRLEGHLPLGFACFCPLCMRALDSETDATTTREALLLSFDQGDWETKLRHRRAWLEHNRAYVADGLRLIRDSVDAVNPALQLGFMTTSLSYSGAGFGEWARELSGEPGLEVLPAKWRPGGGFYTDDTPAALLTKVHSVGAQIAEVPIPLGDIQYEVENFPYMPLKKSATVFAAEIAAAIAAGCTGVALNLFGTAADPLGEYGNYFTRLQDGTPFFERAVGAFGRSACEGIGIPLSRDAFAALNPEGNWLETHPWAGAYSPAEWSEIGLPFCYAPEGRCATLLVGDSVLVWSKDELRQMLLGGVILDGAALGHLSALGLSDLTGFAVRETRDKDVQEIFTGDELNGAFAGWARDCRPSFWPQTSFVLEPTSARSRPLAQLVDFAPQTFGATEGVFENELGGRVAVLGYSPWTMIHSLAKTTQLKALTRWVTRDTLPAYLESYSRAALWCRRDAAGRPALLVLNLSIDVQDITLRVRNAPAEMQLVRMNGEESTQQRGEGQPYGTFSIRELGPWQAALLVADK